jgi:hypothetical protein
MTKPTEQSAFGRVRASDAEREEYAQILRAAMSEGRLSLEVGEERLGRAYAATYRDELDPLLADLPRGAAFRTPEYLDQARQRLRRHRNGVVSVAALLTGIWLLVAILAHPVFFWPIIPIAFLSIGLLRHRRMYRWFARGGWGPRTRWGGGGWDGPGWGGRGWARDPGWAGGPGRSGAWGQGGGWCAGTQGAPDAGPRQAA